MTGSCGCMRESSCEKLRLAANAEFFRCAGHAHRRVGLYASGPESLATLQFRPGGVPTNARLSALDSVGNADGVRSDPSHLPEHVPTWRSLYTARSVHACHRPTFRDGASRFSPCSSWRRPDVCEAGKEDHGHTGTQAKHRPNILIHDQNLMIRFSTIELFGDTAPWPILLAGNLGVPDHRPLRGWPLPRL